MKRILMWLLLLSSIAAAQHTIYIRMADSTYSAQLRGPSGDKLTNGQVIQGTYVTDFNAHRFENAVAAGAYELWFDAAGGSTYSNDAAWTGTGARFIPDITNMTNVLFFQQTADTDNDGMVETAGLEDAAVTTAKIAELGVTSGKLANQSVTNVKLGTASVNTNTIQDSTIVLADISAAAIAGLSPGSVTNNADGTSLNVNGSTISLNMAYVDTARSVSDTTALKARIVSGNNAATVYLESLSSSTPVGGGWFTYMDSTYKEGIIAFGSAVTGKQWVRNAWLEFPGLLKVSWAGADDSDTDGDHAEFQAALSHLEGITVIADAVTPGGEYLLSRTGNNTQVAVSGVDGNTFEIKQTIKIKDGTITTGHNKAYFDFYDCDNWRVKMDKHIWLEGNYAGQTGWASGFIGGGIYWLRFTVSSQDSIENIHVEPFRARNHIGMAIQLGDSIFNGITKDVQLDSVGEGIIVRNMNKGIIEDVIGENIMAQDLVEPAYSNDIVIRNVYLKGERNLNTGDAVVDFFHCQNVEAYNIRQSPTNESKTFAFNVASNDNIFVQNFDGSTATILKGTSNVTFRDGILRGGAISTDIALKTSLNDSLYDANIKFIDVEFTGNSTGVQERSVEINGYAEGIELIGCKITKGPSGTVGIRIAQSTGTGGRGLVIRDCDIYDYANGIQFASGTIDSVTIDGNRFHNVTTSLLNSVGATLDESFYLLNNTPDLARQQYTFSSVASTGIQSINSFNTAWYTQTATDSIFTPLSYVQRYHINQTNVVIDTISVANVELGTVITLFMRDANYTGVKVKDGKNLKLNGDWTPNQDDVLQLMYDRVSDSDSSPFWFEMGRSSN